VQRKHHSTLIVAGPNDVQKPKKHKPQPRSCKHNTNQKNVSGEDSEGYPETANDASEIVYEKRLNKKLLQRSGQTFELYRVQDEGLKRVSHSGNSKALQQPRPREELPN
jgi:hypothetical protein